MMSRTLHAILASLILLSSVYPAQSRAESPPPVIRIGSGAAGSSLGRAMSGGVVGWVASQGYVEREFAGDSTHIEWSHIASAGPGANEAMAAGMVDFVYYGDFPAIIGHAGGLDTELILPVQRNLGMTGLIVPLNSTANNLQDLIGKRIAMHRGRPWELAFHRLLAENHLAEADFQIFNLTDPDGDAALISGNVDAVFGQYSNIVSQKHLARTIWTLREEGPDWRSSSDLFVNPHFAAQYPDTVMRVVRAFIRAGYDATLPENRTGLLTVWAKAGGQSFDVVARDYEGIDFRKNIMPVFDPYITAHYRQAVQEAQAAGVITAPFPVDRWLEPRYALAALKSLHLETYWTPEDAKGNPVNP